MKDKLKSSILNKIKEGSVKQRPKYLFTAQKVLVWFLVFLTLFVSSLLMSVVLEVIVKVGFFEVWGRVPGPGRWFLVFKILPYSVLLIATASLLLDYLITVKTPGAYRISFSKIILKVTAAVLLLGFILQLSGIGGLFHYSLLRGSNLYRKDFDGRVMRWHQPADGVWLGRVSDLPAPSEFKLVDKDGIEWLVNDSGAVWRVVKREPGVKVRVIGEPVAEKGVKAELITPIPGDYDELMGQTMPGRRTNR